MSWNMNRLARSEASHKKAWDYLRDELHADLALVQEARPPAEFKSKVYRPVGKGRYNWGSAVVALRSDLTLQPRSRVRLRQSPIDKNQLFDSHPGACAVADIKVRGHRPFTAISLYGSWEMMPGSDSVCHADPRVHRMLSDLTPVLAAAYRHPVLLAGDLNLSTQWEESQENAAAAVFARLRAWDLVDCIERTRTNRPRLSDCKCPDGDACSHVKTFRNGRQLDYAFLSECAVPTLSDCRVVDDPAAWKLSDHCPILLELNTAES